MEEQVSTRPAGVPVAGILDAVAATMRQERGELNVLSSFAGDATLGTRLERAFRDAADAVAGSGTGRAGEDLQLAGQVLTDPAAGYGQAARYLGQGLILAGHQFLDRETLSLADLGPLLTSLLQGSQQDNPAQPGQGTLLDVLIPAATAYSNAVQARLTDQQAIQGAVGAAMSGVRSTANMVQPFNRHRKGRANEPTGRPDPGAVAAQTLITGLITGLLGDIVPATPPGQTTNNFLLNLLQQGIDRGGRVAGPPRPRDVETLLAGTRRAGPRPGAAPVDPRPGQDAAREG